MSAPFCFFVMGDPKTQGSIRAMPRRGKRLATATFKDIVLTSDTKGLKPWRHAIRAAAIHARVQLLGSEGLRGVHCPEGPVRLRITFILARPQRLKGATREEHHVLPDRDKLERAVLDALKGIIYTDDGQVCGGETTKWYAAPGEATGVYVHVNPTD
jgi:Holliday junction resolvase RusA-like endonuclease